MTRIHKLSKRKKRDYLFVALLLAYPVLQFVITWGFVNIGSILMAFQKSNGWETQWTFDNFVTVVKNLFETTLNTTGTKWLNNQTVIILNSLGYAVITIFISLPLSLLFSYFLQKNMPFANVFRVIFFLPNIIPIVALAMAFNTPLKENGYIYEFFRMIGINMSSNLYAQWPTSQITVYLYCIWAGLGYNVVLMSGAIGRIPKEIFESAQLDGAGYFTEFTKITIPLIWPTIVTLVVLGMTNVLTLYLQPYLLSNGTTSGNIYSIAMEIFETTASSQDANALNQMAAKGLLFSVIWAPIVMLVRSKMSKKYDDVDF